MRKNFWKNIPITELTAEEWEAICDGCGKCCLIKLQEHAKSAPYFTSVACKFLNTNNCKCKVYKSRKQKKSDCIILTPKNIKKIKDWLPSTCAYRLVSEKKDLPEWHHLNTKSYNTVHLTNNSVQKLAVSELLVDEEDLENFVMDL